MNSKHTARWSLVLSLLLLGCSPAAHALEFRVLGWSSDDITLHYGKKSTLMTVSVNGFSPAYEFHGDGPLVFYKMVDKDGNPQRQTACTITFPPDMQRGLIILFPGDESTVANRKVISASEGPGTPDAPLVYDYLLLDDSTEARPSGTIEFRNFSSLPVALMVESRQFVLQPKAKAQLPLDSSAKRLSFRAAAQVNGQWKVFLTNPLPTRGRPERMMVLLRDGPIVAQPQGDVEPNIKLLSLSDFPPRPQAPASTDVASVR